MSDAAGTDIAEQVQETPQDQASKKFAEHFEQAVSNARWIGYAERLWGRAAPTVGGLTGLFLTASWFGLWQNVTPSVRMAGVALFAAALATAVKPLLKVRRPDRGTALDRLDRESGLGNRPASTYDDIPANEEGIDEETKALWRAQKKRIERQVGTFSAGSFSPQTSKHDSVSVRLLLAMTTAASLMIAASQGQVVERVETAFDWTESPVLTEPVKVDAWITPPHYTKEQMRAAGPLDTNFNVPANSKLTLNVQDENARITVEGGITTLENSCKSSSYKNATECEFKLTENATVSIDRGKQHGMISWQFNVTPDKAPSIAVVPVSPAQSGRENDKNPVLQLDVTVEDDHGAEMTDGRIKPVKPADPDAELLPLYRVPGLTVVPK